MTTPSPLRQAQEEYHRAPRSRPAGEVHRPGAAQGERGEPAPLEIIPYGALRALSGGFPELLASFGDLESEYAALRRGAGILDAPHRGTLVFTGPQRLDFLDRMLTQHVANAGAGSSTRSFWLNRKGRIEADLLLAELGDRLVTALDIHCAASTAASLDGYVFTEDVELRDASAEYHHLALYGPAAPATFAAAAGLGSFDLEVGASRVETVAGVETIAVRNDQTGDCGIEVIMPRDGAEAVWWALVDADGTVGESKRRVRPVGWHAFNIARIEAGTPLHFVDFGPDNLPHETGLVEDRVSFKKGCYLGQEIVSRTQNLGRPSKSLVGLRPETDALPVAGDDVYATSDGPSIGGVTSSTLSPMLGRQPVAFAMIKANWTAPGTRVVVSVEGDFVDATVGPMQTVGATTGVSEERG